MPSDVSVTPDGAVAIVRASERLVANPPTTEPDGISAWNMADGARITISGTLLSGYGLGENQGFLLTNGSAGTPLAVHFSDLVQTTNSRAIAIGSQRSADTNSTPDDTTFVDFLAINNANDPPIVTHLAHSTLTGTGATGIAGHAHDVAVTPNGAIAVVSHRNWVHFFTMSTGAARGSDNIGAHVITFPQNGFQFSISSPDLAVDSVEVANTRAVVITTKTTNPASAQVIMAAYVYDLTANPVTRIAALNIGDATALEGAEVKAHDVAITPDGTMAVVTGNCVAALIDLFASPPSVKGRRVDLQERRSYNMNADTVEVTNTRAVVTASRVTGTTPFWTVAVFDLNSFALVGGPYSDQNTGTKKDAHDLTITPNGKKAIVRGGTTVIVIEDLDSPPSAATEISTSGDASNAYTTPYPSVASDSVIATNHVAFGIGTNGGAANSDGILAFVDLSVTPSTLIAEAIITNGVSGNRVHSCDLSLVPNGTRVVVRSADTSLAPANVDIRFYSAVLGSISTTPIWSTGATDNLFSVDSLEMGTNSLISISEARVANNGAGHVQIVRIH